MKMTNEQANIAVPLLNSYAHQYLGLPADAVSIAGARIEAEWILILATIDGVKEAEDFDAAKAIIDKMERAA